MNRFKYSKDKKNRTDHEWIRELQAKDQEAVDALWEMVFYFGAILARRYDQGEDIGRDAAIDAFLRLQHSGINKFAFRCPFPAYVRKFVVNEVFRRLKKLPPTHSELFDEVHEDEEERVEKLETEKDRVRERLEPCLELLPPRKRELIDKRYVKDELPQFIADKVGITRNNVNKVVHDARKKLRECLEQRGFFTTGDVLGL